MRATDGAIGNQHRSNERSARRQLLAERRQYDPRLVEDVQHTEARHGVEATRRERQVAQVGLHEDRGCVGEAPGGTLERFRARTRPENPTRPRPRSPAAPGFGRPARVRERAFPDVSVPPLANA